MILIFLVQICLPCLLTILLLPIMCFCTPCFIRILARLQDPVASRGATDSTINTIKLVTIDAELLSSASSNSTCPICISEMVIGEQARVLPCSHFFHKDCVDEWLGVNASCPTCRAGINERPQSPVMNNNTSIATGPELL
jgi:E3 ubiquitin-protein ligase RNF38/44